MPRDGSNIYHRPAGTDAVTDTTIESSKYNALVADLEQDLNLPRPIVAGGTGAINADAALVALGAEKGNQVITNFDSAVWVSGSFSAASSATAPPAAGHAFAGIAYAVDANNLTVEARDATDSKLYIRRKTAGVWGAWVQDTLATDTAIALKVAKAGDIMTGNLGITKADPALALNKTAVNQNNAVTGTLNGTPRWFMALGNGSAESGSNAGSDFSIYRYNDAGTFVGEALGINRSTGNVTLAGQAFVGSSITAGSAGAIGSYFFGNSGTKFLTYDGANYTLTGGNLTINGAVIATSSFNVGSSVYGPISAEIGSTSVAGPAFIDFHSSGTTADYDARIIASGGSATIGQGGLTINAAALVVNSPFAVNNYIQSITGGGVGGLYHFGNTGTKSLSYDGTNFSFAGGGVFNTGVIQSNVADGVRVTAPNGQYGRMLYTVAGTRTWSFGCEPAGTLGWADESGGVRLMGLDLAGSLNAVGNISANSGYRCKQGISLGTGTFTANVFNFWFSNPTLFAYMDNTNVGVSSDYRVKQDVTNLPGMWETVKRLRPIKYKFTDFSPPSYIAHHEKKRQAGEDYDKGTMFHFDGVEHWGFIAHELQETLLPSVSTGVKDSPDTIQSPYPLVVVAVLTKALQEAMERIEKLEARL